MSAPSYTDSLSKLQAQLVDRLAALPEFTGYTVLPELDGVATPDYNEAVEKASRQLGMLAVVMVPDVKRGARHDHRRLELVIEFQENVALHRSVTSAAQFSLTVASGAVTAASVASGGAGYPPNADVLVTLPGGAQLLCHTNSSGAIDSVSEVSAGGAGYTGNGSSSGVTLTARSLAMAAHNALCGWQPTGAYTALEFDRLETLDTKPLLVLQLGLTTFLQL